MVSRSEASVPADWWAELTRPLPLVPPVGPLYTGAPEGPQFRDREVARHLAAFAALAAGFHQPLRGPRDPARWLAGAALVVGGFGLLTHHRWPERVSLVGCGLAVGAMLARPAPLDGFAVAAALTAARALVALSRAGRR